MTCGSPFVAVVPFSTAFLAFALAAALQGGAGASFFAFGTMLVNRLNLLSYFVMLW